ncbi:hypothetical protein CEXT_590611 [Caerostris extrusa]|uniref:Uncharacterized protein n=1 Tax=Caerostris extrusa TaxID=172846 RepID=A0AAV4X4C4_CAEEX|nr:hypothetical protein CEXT_590611 [Caerostris extrusa]
MATDGRLPFAQNHEVGFNVVRESRAKFRSTPLPTAQGQELPSLLNGINEHPRTIHKKKVRRREGVNEKGQDMCSASRSVAGALHYSEERSCQKY